MRPPVLLKSLIFTLMANEYVELKLLKTRILDYTEDQEVIQSIADEIALRTRQPVRYTASLSSSTDYAIISVYPLPNQP